jgi:hypothetical protein
MGQDIQSYVTGDAVELEELKRRAEHNNEKYGCSDHDLNWISSDLLREWLMACYGKRAVLFLKKYDNDEYLHGVDPLNTHAKCMHRELLHGYP